MNMVLRWMDTGQRFLGPLGLAGLALILGGLAFRLLVVQPEFRKAEAVEQAAIRMAAYTPPIGEATQMPDEAEQLARFYEQFPRASELSALIEKLHLLARQSGVTLRMGEYKLDRSSTGMLWRYEVLLPIEAGYPELRRFIDLARDGMPTLGLSEVAFKREAIGDRAVKTRLRFVLYVLRDS